MAPGWMSYSPDRLVAMPGSLFSLPLADGFQEPLRHKRFVGREPELAALSDLLRDRRSATVLIAGFRGAGKTALVDHALESVAGKKQLVVRLAPPFLDNANDARNSVRAQVLRSLARGLYFAVNDDDSSAPKSIRERIEATYEKTYLLEMETSSLIESVATAEARRSVSTSVKASFEGSTAAKMLAGGLTMALVGTLGLGTALVAADRFGIGWSIATVVTIIALAVATALRIEKVSTSTKDLLDSAAQKDSRSNAGRLDLSEETLEFELRRSLEELSKDGYRVVFVLDELDKLEAATASTGTALEETPVFKIVASLKNFFSLGSAIYIFITDDAFFETLALQQRGIGYSLSHTVFTDRFFVGPLHYSELEDLLDRSVAKRPTGDAAEAFDRFKNFVCWESNNHVFDAIQILGSYAEGGGAHERCLAPTESGELDGIWREGNLPDDWLTRAALQKHVGVTFDEARRSGPGEALYNQALWETLHLAAQQLLDGHEIVVVEDDVIDCPGRFFDGLQSVDQAGVSSAVHRMLIRLERHGAADERVGPLTAADDATDAAAATPAEDPIQATRYSLRDAIPYPPASIAAEAALLPFEAALIEVVRRLVSIRDNCSELVDLDEEDLNGIKRAEAVATRVQRSGPRRTVKRSVVERTIPAASQHAESVLSDSVQALVESWADERGYSHASALSAAHPRLVQQQWVQVLSPSFKPVTDALTAAKSSFRLIGDGTSENSMLVLLMPPSAEADRIANTYARCMSGSDKDREQRRHLLPIVHIAVSTGEDDPLPTETVDVLEEVEPQGWFARIFGASTKVRQETQQLEGWYRFLLNTDASNLRALDAQLESASYLRSGD